MMEIVLRIIGYNPLKEELAGRENILRKSSVDEMVYEGVPNSEGYVWGSHIKLNAFGLRDMEYNMEKREGTYRIIVLGDSITFGNTMSLDDIYTEQLEGLYAEKNKQVEVINLGMTGYDTLAEVSALEHKGMRFDPDMVIIGYCVNDIAISGNIAEIIRAEKYSSPLYRARVVQFIGGKIARLREIMKIKKINTEEEFMKRYGEQMSDISNDNELNVMIDDLSSLMTEMGDDDNYLAGLYTSKAHLRKLRYSFERLRHLRDTHGFDVVVMIISYLNEDELSKKKYQIIYNIIAHEAGREGFDVLNTYNVFSSTGFDNLLRADNDAIHPNELGHKLMADLLYQHIDPKIIR
jgi:lysophospholipase L1-like esterase